jgi:hypothetical protein
MAKTLAKVLKTDISRLPLRKAAEEVRKKGRGRDTILAHITPREAAKLKAEGGSGTINPDTGLPEFEDGFDFGGFFDPTPMAYQPADFSSFEAPSYTPEFITQEPMYQAPTQDYTFLSRPTEGFVQPFQAAQYDYGFQPDIGASYYAGAFPDQYAQATPAEIAQGRADVQNAYRTMYAPLPPDIAAKAYGTGGTGGGEALRAVAQERAAFTPAEGGLTEEERKEIERQLARDLPAVRAEERAAAQLAAAQKLSAQTGGPAAPAETKGIQTPFGTLGTKELIAALGLGALGLNYSRAQSQGKQAAQALQNAYNQAAAQTRELAQPYMQQGGQQLALATQGALSPAQQQQLAAGQAAAAQATASSGGVAAAQAGRSVEDLRQRLLANQQTMALQLLGTGTPLISQAIRDQLAGTTTGINTNMQLSQQAGQAASGMLAALGAMYARG